MAICLPLRASVVGRALCIAIDLAGAAYTRTSGGSLRESYRIGDTIAAEKAWFRDSALPARRTLEGT